MILSPTLAWRAAAPLRAMAPFSSAAITYVSKRLPVATFNTETFSRGKIPEAARKSGPSAQLPS